MIFTKSKVAPDFNTDGYFSGEMQSMIAKKAFKIVHNDYEKTINEGDDLSDVPAVYWPNLISEGVL